MSYITEFDRIKTQILVIDDDAKVESQPNDAESIELVIQRYTTAQQVEKLWNVFVAWRTDVRNEEIDHRIVFRKVGTWRVTLFRPINISEETSSEFQLYIDSLVDGLTGNSNLFTTHPLFSKQTVDAVIEEKMIGDILCHHVELLFELEEELVK